MTALWGHRGAPLRARENTVESFRAAVAEGADGIELDVRCAPDGRLVVFHDDLPDPLPAWVPGLGEALDACGEVLVNVELKEPLAVEVLPFLEGRDVLVSCFDIDVLHPLVGVVPTAWLVMVASPGDVDVCAGRGHVAYHPYHASVDAGLVQQAHEAGLAVNTWTVDDPARYAELVEMGVDAVVTNDLAALRGSAPAARGGT